MRVSGVAQGDGGSVGSVVQFPRPVAPVVSSGRSCNSSTGDSVCNCAGEKVCASNGGADGAGSFCNCASVTGCDGALPASGVGRNGAYAIFPGFVSVLVLMKYEVGLIVVNRDCCAAAWFHPGEPSALTMPRERRLATR